MKGSHGIILVGITLQKKGEYEKSINYHEKGLNFLYKRLDLGDACVEFGDLYKSLGIAYEKIGNKSKAIENYENAIFNYAKLGATHKKNIICNCKTEKNTRKLKCMLFIKKKSTVLITLLNLFTLYASKEFFICFEFGSKRAISIKEKQINENNYNQGKKRVKQDKSELC
ncbi:hypothetical protein RFI_00888 [Reticulomyxa filosa]|uniref:Tetratricopeptide repeat protein n=1 Tax=Reticulomyxa filosa TaxID=46433 RepID=X6PCC6_RETFI|nr:hypothetical protein RFI_00888 [Reticulomyxa filosa]|eukprot:ETO36175.1 hypothetical protein RFI_00888 [Reticulomyxa filosa]